MTTSEHAPALRGKEETMAQSTRQVVFAFPEAGDLTAEKIGGKASSLVTMERLGLPVPPGLVIPTGVCRAFVEQGGPPKRLANQLRRGVSNLERVTGKRFGARRDPLLVSVRSGAPMSMPGMLDSVLNLGVTEESAAALKRIGGDAFANDVVQRFNAGFEHVVGCTPPDDPWEQLRLAISAVWRSWFNPRAIAYREAQGISNYIGTATTVQMMTFGNLDADSGTGVAFSRNVASGDPQLYGEWLPCAQGEDVVGGAVVPLPLAALAEMNPRAYRELAGWAGVLESHYGDVVDIEYTIEAGRLWLLQCRPAKRTPYAAARFAVQSVWEKRATKQQVVQRLTERDAEALRRPSFDATALQSAAGNGQFFARGLAAAPGAAIGKAVFSSEQAKKMANNGERVILFRPDTNPDDLPGMMASAAVVTAAGGVTSHAAVVARSLGIPAVVGVTDVAIDTAAVGKSIVREGDLVSVDGAEGLVLLGTVPLNGGNHHKEVNIFLRWLAALRPELFDPTIGVDWTALERRVSANRLLNDFYLADVMASAAVGTVLEVEAQEVRRQVVGEVGSTLLTYLTLAVAGELRHAPESLRGCSCGHCHNAVEAVQTLRKRFGYRFDEDRLPTQLLIARRLRGHEDDLLAFFTLADELFSLKDWGSSVGGERWAAIARAPRLLLSGKMKPAVFIDHVFDLRHNGGVLFDKHVMVSSETDERRIQFQLEVKKKARSIVQLHSELAPYAPFSPRICELWQRGDKLGCWARTATTAA